jgi:hypothetical protein
MKGRSHGWNPSLWDRSLLFCALKPRNCFNRLCSAVQVGSILLTGSAQTYDAIVWGKDKSKVRQAAQ